MIVVYCIAQMRLAANTYIFNKYSVDDGTKCAKCGNTKSFGNCAEPNLMAQAPVHASQRIRGD